ncbi:MAG: hypothetical protein ACK5ND_02625 [Bacteroides sp.]
MEDKIREAKAKALEALFSQIHPFIVQIYKKESEDEPIDISALASGVLFEFNNGYYLLTAGHVYENETVQDIGTFINGDFYVLQGAISYLSPCKSKENNKGDIAVCKLLPEVAEDLKQYYSFTTIEQIAMNHILSEENRYFIFGYPVTKTKKNTQRKTIKPIPFKFVTKGITTPQIYQKLDLDNGTNFLLDFHRKKLADTKTNIKQTAPKPYGISGTGLWYLDKDKKIYLVGIMTEWRDKESSFLSTRIDLPIELIHHRFDNTIPQSNVIKPSFE